MTAAVLPFRPRRTHSVWDFAHFHWPQQHGRDDIHTAIRTALSELLAERRSTGRSR